MLVCFQRAASDEICGETVLSVKMGETILARGREYLKCFCKKALTISFELLNDQLSFREKTLYILGHLQNRSITVKLYRCILLCNNFPDVELG